MPTGYTYKVQEGKTTDFKEFALECARAFGALASMRDTPNADIPEEFKVSDYTKQKVEENLEQVKFWGEVSEEDAAKLAEEEYKREKEYLLKIIDKKKIEKERYEDMIQKVEDWTPPTKEHEGLKDFMLQQLKDSLKSDTSTSYYEDRLAALSLASGREYKIAQLEEAAKSLQFADERFKKEEKSVAEKNQWLKDLRNSL